MFATNSKLGAGELHPIWYFSNFKGGISYYLGLGWGDKKKWNLKLKASRFLAEGEGFRGWNLIPAGIKFLQNDKGHKPPKLNA